MTDKKSLFNLTGRVALITGGSRGLGAEIAEGLAEAGAAVFLVARRERWLNPTLAEFRTQGFSCDGALCDVSDSNEVDHAVRQALQRFGQVDILVNNAGITWGSDAAEMPLEKWRAVLDVNLTGAWIFAQAIGKHMIERKRGNILTVASVSGLMGSTAPGVSVAGYAASKAGVMGLTRELAGNWGPYGVRVNALAPGFFPSRMTEKILDRVSEHYRDRIPLRRIGKSGELKGAALFLCSDASSYVTGQTIVVDGGLTAS
jgi:NAD(P)-dependent dehydrogenase (short-subunit alcohol dehydrogenase family)